MFYEYMNKHVPVLLKEITEYLQPKNGDVIIDCTLGGGGHTMALLEKVYPDGAVISIDADNKVIENFQRQIDDSQYKNNSVLIHDNFRNLSAIAEKLKGDDKFKKYVQNNCEMVTKLLCKRDVEFFDQGEESQRNDLRRSITTVKTISRQLDEASGKKNKSEQKEFCNHLSINGIVCDLGLSSNQLEDEARGFSFLKDSPLDMRFGGSELTAEYILNNYTPADIYKIIQEYGEEKFAWRIAQNIAQERRKAPIKTCFGLLEILKRSIPQKLQHGRTHYATKTFQALRIAVNDELGALTDFLPQALEVLSPQGRLAIISFHSLEDRIVKIFFRDKAKKEGVVKLLTKKPIVPADEEIAANPRSRSAKLRVIQKI